MILPGKLGNFQPQFKIKIVFLFILFLFLCACWIIYAIFGHGVIENAYHGKSLPQLNNLIQYQYKKPVEHYLSLGDYLMHAFLIGTFLFFVILFSVEQIIIGSLDKYRFAFSANHIRILLYTSLPLRLLPAAFSHKCFAVGDEGYYWGLYKHLILDHNLSMTVWHPPLWGYVLIIPHFFSADPISGRFLSACIGALTPILVYLLGARFFDKKTGFLAGLLYVIYPTHIAFSHYLWSEVLFIFLLLFSLNLFFNHKEHKNKYFKLPFFVLGISLLTKEFTIIFFISLMVVLFFTRDNLRHYMRQVVVGSVCFFLPLLMYSAVISVSLHKVIVLNESPISNFRTAAGLDETFLHVQQDEEERTQFVKEYLSYYFNRPLSEMLSSTKKQFFNLWTPNSFPVTRLLADNPSTEYGWSYGFQIKNVKLIVSFVVIFYLLMMIFGLTGLCLTKFNEFFIFSVTCLLLLSGLSTFSFLCSRFRLSFMFIFIIFTAELILHPNKYLQNIRRPARAITLLALLTIFIMIVVEKLPILGEWG